MPEGCEFRQVGLSALERANRKWRRDLAFADAPQSAANNLPMPIRNKQ